MGTSPRSRTTLRRGLYASAVMVGCGGSTVTPDASAPRDAGSVDTPDVDVATPDAPDADPVTCVIDGSGPLAVTLRGTAVGERGSGRASALTETIDLYLPRGRVAGAPVVYAFQSTWPYARLEALAGTLDATLGNGGLAFHGYRGGQVDFTVRLVGPDRGAVMDVTRNLNERTDSAEVVTARVPLCPVGAPAPELSVGPRVIVPTVGVSLVPSAPIATGLDAVRVTVGGEAAPANVSYAQGVLTVTPAAPWPVGGDIAVDTSSLRDLMGRAFTVPDPITTLRTTAEVSDLTFETAPPPGAVVPGAGVEMGRLTIGAVPVSTYFLIALGDRGAVSRVSMRYRYEYRVERVSFRLIDADGRWTAFTPTEPAGVDVEAVADMNARGPLWIVFARLGALSAPGTLPLMNGALWIDEVTITPAE
ncbi:MAG: hypothetical protein R3A52_14875 [Polyangiales bacterium]